MRISTNIHATTKVQSKFDPTATFIIGLMTGPEREAINAMITKKLTGEDVAAEVIIRAYTELGLRGWENLSDDNNEEIKYTTVEKSVLNLPKRQVISPELYDLPRAYDLWVELCEKIKAYNSIAEQASKN